jgi:serine/threonine protein phosphatase PrpC
MPFRLQVAGKSDVGCVRSNNEDSFGYRLSADERSGVLIVCDGMGGQPFGEVASDLAVKTVLQRFAAGGSEQGSEFLAEAIAAANAAIREAARDPEMEGMGTTIVAALANGDSVTIAHAGDSRAYLVRAGKMQPLTSDHSYVMEQVRRGIINAQEAETSSLQNIILRALGTDENVEVDIGELAPRAGDILLLCSDGLTRMVPEAVIAKIISGDASGALAGACDDLIAAARAAGGQDNITCLLARFIGE